MISNLTKRGSQKCSWMKMPWLHYQGRFSLNLYAVKSITCANYYHMNVLASLSSTDRPGTSLNTPQTASKSGGSYDPAVRPVSQSGRPVTGFARPSSSRPITGSSDVRGALQSSRRSSTARPMTTLGREVRLGTASLSASSTGALVDVEKLNVRKYASRTGLAMVLTDYLIYVEHNTRKALEMCAEATKEHGFKNWWWKARLGKCYFKLGKLTSSPTGSAFDHFIP